MMVRLTFRSNDTTHENRICCSHFNSKECIAVCGNCSLGCKWEEEVWSKLAHYEDLEEAGRLIELPCKIGDAVYGIRRYHSDRKVQSGVVSEMYFSQKNRLIIVIKHIGRGYWGESIFGSFEEAEAALKERELE